MRKRSSSTPPRPNPYPIKRLFATCGGIVASFGLVHCAVSSEGLTAVSYNASASSGPIACSADSSTPGGSARGAISADTPSADGTRLFPRNASFNITFVTASNTGDDVTWSIRDYLDKPKASGHFPVKSGTWTTTLRCTSTISGYFAIAATLPKTGATLPRSGTRPAGLATFGVLPELSAYLPPVKFNNLDQHRFGMQGFGGRPRMLSALGVTQTIDDRQLASMEPNGPNTWAPSLARVDPSYTTGKLLRLIRVDALPAWLSPVSMRADRSHAPRDLGYYERYMARVGSDSDAIRRTYVPAQHKNYYQVTWEPAWQDTPMRLISMYQSAYKGLHSTDPNAMVMAPTEPDPGTSCRWSCTGTLLQNYASLGLAKYIDGVTTHAYWGDTASPAFPPEQHDTDPLNAPKALDQQMRSLRALMQTMKPNMPLWATEVGIGYDKGQGYGPNWPTSNQLYAQAAVGTRTHLIILGEGAQVTYFFYGPDFPSEVGFGTYFDLSHEQGSYSASVVSPKPEALAFAALTRVIDGTRTLGHLNDLPPTVHGYAFQQLGGGKVVTALWMHNNSVWPVPGGNYSASSSTTYKLRVDSASQSGYVTVLDMMGNPYRLPYTNGVVELTLTEAPLYVVSSNADVARAGVTAPIGYTGQ